MSKPLRDTVTVAPSVPTSTEPAGDRASPPVTLREARRDELQAWDEIIARFPQRRIVHTRGWIQSLEASGLGRPVYLLYERGGMTVACWPGLLARRGPFRIFGSPLPGWQTAGMGPVYDPERIAGSELVQLLMAFLKRRRIHHVEIVTSALDGDAMRAAGFRGEETHTFRGALTPADPMRTFKAFKDSARRNVKRAARLGLTVRFEADDRFVDEHYSQICDVFTRGGHAVPFGRKRVAAHVQGLRETGHLIGVSVYLEDGVTNIATGTFTAYAGELLLWMWAHKTAFRWHRPTELMTWAVMQRAMEAGCTAVDFMGRGDFKANLGAVLTSHHTRWVWSRYRWLTRARDYAGSVYRWQQRLRGVVLRAWRSRSTVPQSSSESQAGAGRANGGEPAAERAPTRAPRDRGV